MTTRPTAHFYHLYAGAGGAWKTPLAEHLAALANAGWEGRVFVGVVGEEREEAAPRVRWMNERVRNTPLHHTVVLFGNDEEQWEQFTLDLVRRYAWRNSGVVMYAHSKGAGNPNPTNDRWRQEMTRRVVSRWETNLAALDIADAVGYDWRSDHFSGNYWMATCEYLMRLPVCARKSRYDAERWIGLENPRIMDVRERRGHFLVPD